MNDLGDLCFGKGRDSRSSTTLHNIRKYEPSGSILSIVGRCGSMVLHCAAARCDDIEVVKMITQAYPEAVQQKGCNGTILLDQARSQNCTGAKSAILRYLEQVSRV